MAHGILQILYVLAKQWWKVGEHQLLMRGFHLNLFSEKRDRSTSKRKIKKNRARKPRSKAIRCIDK